MIVMKIMIFIRIDKMIARAVVVAVVVETSIVCCGAGAVGHLVAQR